MIKTLLSALTILVILIVLVSVWSRPMTLGTPVGRAPVGLESGAATDPN